MPIEELIARLRSIWSWAPKNSTARQLTAELIQRLGAVPPQEYVEPQPPIQTQQEN
jgi:hypothetical protein